MFSDQKQSKAHKYRPTYVLRQYFKCKTKKGHKQARFEIKEKAEKPDFLHIKKTKDLKKKAEKGKQWVAES